MFLPISRADTYIFCFTLAILPVTFMAFLNQKFSLMLRYTFNHQMMILILMKIVTQKRELISNIHHLTFIVQADSRMDFDTYITNSFQTECVDVENVKCIVSVTLLSRSTKWNHWNRNHWNTNRLISDKLVCSQLIDYHIPLTTLIKNTLKKYKNTKIYWKHRHLTFI